MNFIFEPWHWFVLGILLILSELFLTAFAALWFGVAAIGVCILLWIFPSMSFVWQIIFWIVLSVLCTWVWFKYFKPRSNQKAKLALSRDSTIGQTGMVIETGLAHSLVRVRFPIPLLGSDEWDCRALTPVSIGDRVRVTDILGNQLVVQAHTQSAPPL